MECLHVSLCQTPMEERRKARGSCLCQCCLKVSSWWWEAMMATSDCALENILSLHIADHLELGIPALKTEDHICQACR